mgnify:CR=1 FL=1
MVEGNPSMETEALRSVIHTGSLFERIVGVSRLTGSFVCYKDMARNLKRYYQAWELRQQNKIFKEIGKIMGITGSRAAVLSNYVDFKINNQKQRRISNELKKLVKKFSIYIP